MDINDKNNLKIELEDNINIAKKGREVWQGILDKYPIDNKVRIIIFPEDNKLVNYYTLSYINQAVKELTANKFIIVTYSDTIKKVARLFSDNVTEVIMLDKKAIFELIKFYSFYMFTDKLIIASLIYPEGRNADRLIGTKDIELKELIALGLFLIKNSNDYTRPIYDGDDKDIIEFLNI